MGGWKKRGKNKERTAERSEAGRADGHERAKRVSGEWGVGRSEERTKHERSEWTRAERVKGRREIYKEEGSK